MSSPYDQHDPHHALRPAGARNGLAEIHAALEGLTATVRREHERAAHREAIIDRLHEDNQGLRRGELQAMFEPVRSALYRLHDLVRRESQRWAAGAPPDPAAGAPATSAAHPPASPAASGPASPAAGAPAGPAAHPPASRAAGAPADPAAGPPPDPAHVAPLLATIADEIAEALARTGVERFAVKPGDPFDPARHRPVATRPVDDLLLDGAVVDVRADGFERGETIVRKAEVCVGRLAQNGSET